MRRRPSSKALAAHWAQEKPSFATVLKRELSSMESANRGAVLALAQRMETAIENGDWLDMFEGVESAIMRQFRALRVFFEKRGVAPEESTAEVLKFWGWAGNHHQPQHRISSYLFAGLARRIANNQRTPDKGMMNDIRAISTYGPFITRAIGTEVELRETKFGDGWSSDVRNLVGMSVTRRTTIAHRGKQATATLVSTFRDVGPTSIDVLGNAYQVRQIDETMVAENRTRILNSYWVDSVSGEWRKARQQVIPLLAPVNTMIVKSPRS